jgi:enoyl-CoA hydratase/carnithine racemase
VQQYRTIRVGTSDSGSYTLTLDRPDQRNAFTDEMLAEISHVVATINRDTAAKVLVLRGSPQAFCSGRDRSELAEVARRDSTSQLPPAGGHESAIIRRCEVPTIAVVEGPAVGGGLGLALQCDVRVATPAARFLDGHLAAGMVSSVPVWYVPRLIGAGAALRLLCSSEGVSGPEAARLGLVDELVEQSGLEDAVLRWVGDFARWPGELIRHTKALVTQALTGSYEATMQSVGSLRVIGALRPGAAGNGFRA